MIIKQPVRACTAMICGTALSISAMKYVSEYMIAEDALRVQLFHEYMEHQPRESHHNSTTIPENPTIEIKPVFTF